MTVQTYGLGRVFGMLSAVHSDCIRLSNTISMHETDDSRWFGEIERANWEESAVGRPETLIPIHQLTSVTCEDDDFDQSPPDNTPSSIATTPEIKLANLSDVASTEDNETNPLVSVDDRVELRIGARLVPFASESSRVKSLPERIKSLRREVLNELGFGIPLIRVKSDFNLEANQYQIIVNGAVLGSSHLKTDSLLAILPENKAVRNLDGEETREPVFSLPALWISQEQRKTAESQQCTVVDAISVLMTHLGEVAKNLRFEFLSHEMVHRMLQELRLSSYSLVDENFPNRIPTHLLHRVLCELLRERIKISCFEKIVETLVWHYDRKLTFDQIYEHIRTAVGRNAVAALLGESKKLRAITLPGEFQAKLTSPSESGSLNFILDPLTQVVSEQQAGNSPVAIVVPRPLRRIVCQLLAVLDSPPISVFAIEELAYARELNVDISMETLTKDSIQEDDFSDSCTATEHTIDPTQAG